MRGISYKKCIDCEHSFLLYVLSGNGIKITCKITGEVLIIDECPMDD